MSNDLDDRTVMVSIAVICLTIVAIAILTVRPDAVVLAPITSAVLLLLGYEGYRQVESNREDK